MDRRSAFSREHLRLHLLDRDAASGREVTDAPLVHRAPPCGHERVQLGAFGLSEASIILEIEKLREALALLWVEGILLLVGVIKAG